MNELAELRKEVDELRGRVAQLECQGLNNMADMATAEVMARGADRKTSAYRAEIREGFDKINADLAQVVALLTSLATADDRPARRPENTQSAMDRPLT
jgi:hypothetical protein